MNDAMPRETAQGFSIIAQLLRDSQGVARKGIALTTRNNERLTHVERELERLRNANPEALRQEFDSLRRDVEALRRREAALSGLDPTAQVESVKGQWTFYGLVITSITGLITGLLSLFVK